MIKITEKTFRDIGKKVGAEKMAQIVKASGVPVEVPQNVEELALRPDGSDDKPKTIAERNPSQVDYVLFEHDVVESNTEKIVQIHHEIQKFEKVNLEKAYSIGELLLEQKKRIQDRQFGRWMDKFLPFTRRTGQNYMKLFLSREKLEKENVQSLTEAYACLKGEPIPDEVIDADDSLDTKGKCVINETFVEVDDLKLPKKKAQGLMNTLDISKEVISQIRNQDYPFLDTKGRYLKVVVKIPIAKYMDGPLIGEFVCAVSSLLKPGGKLIFHKT